MDYILVHNNSKHKVFKETDKPGLNSRKIDFQVMTLSSTSLGLTWTYE